MLTLKNIDKCFSRGSTHEVIALKGININITEGDFLTIIGSNGAGKSTLLNMIAGTILPDKGIVKIDNHDVSRKPEHERAKYIGRVFQDPLMGTAPSMTIEENLILSIKRYGRGLRLGVTPKRREFFCSKLAQLDLGLENMLSKKVAFLSGGQRQALTILMATMFDPKLLLLDEHTASLDPEISKRIQAITQSIVKEKKLTTIMVTHNMQEALRLGNRTIMMDRGRIILDIAGKKRENVTIDYLLKQFSKLRKEEYVEDELVLA
ncbi:MAG: ATP-binding cassette domain-containing protein [Candidatus Caldatribacteriota bacterium]|jgi:putative ABC transport system ATP-binding protein|nr:ATP-binding cassette domain-containing protein [Atribacterota bacterium]MDD3031910.1 ATP-binding cassette domain-containing protein [Atribacterota bacterium]MDD3641112.1 ATP-binding cassette domain-containing protein [Atribacterota bacterium]MDD4289341.1 ATP-binding cassette domain-containing protein [Atribacterota bacterium]MDD4764406.1 ATP-binding cassette domain-containing protein [Atribacterota bacterium]